MKVTIYSPHNSRSDYIVYQYNSIRRHLKDEYEYIVINDAVLTPDYTNLMNPNAREDIRTVCKELGIPCVEFPPELHEHRRSLFPNSYTEHSENYSQKTANVFQFAVNHSADKEGIVMLMDGDMFFCKDVSLTQHLEGVNLSYLDQHRQNIHYMWNGIVWYKPQEIPNVREMNFDTGRIPGNPLDAGGMTHEYLQKYKDRLSIRHVVSIMEAFPSKKIPDIFDYPSCLQANAFLQDVCQSTTLDKERFPDWQTLDGFICHYREGGNWNKRSYQDHLIKTRTFLDAFADSLF